ncbi:MFS transporter [Achromobacter aloeverae]
MPSMQRTRYVLPIIVLSQFAGTSLWFAGNAVIGDLGLRENAAALAASAVQLGFILGTLASVRWRLSDRISAPTFFFACCAAGAATNYFGLELAVEAGPYKLPAVLLVRFGVGLTLAGIYPVGIKIAASWYRAGLGTALGYLTGALVLGTAFPHLVRGLGANVPWQWVMGVSSTIAAIGGATIWKWVPEGPYTRSAPPQSMHREALFAALRLPRSRAAALGYFGHMWELYAFWTFVPFVLATHARMTGSPGNVPLWSFIVIAMGASGCIVGGYISRQRGSAMVAFVQLSISGACCLISPMAFFLPSSLFIAFMLVWGIAVVGDSPQFSTLNALEAPPDQVGTVVTLVNCIGFAITIVTIQLLGQIAGKIPIQFLMLPLALGPVAGLTLFAKAFRADIFGAGRRNI